MRLIRDSPYLLLDHPGLGLRISSGFGIGVRVQSPCSPHRMSCYNPAPLQQKFLLSFNSLVPAARANPHPAATESGGAMTFYDPTLYGRDEEEEFGDSGAYSESLEEDFEEEEEEEESGTPTPEMGEPESIAVPPPPPPKPRPTPPAPSGGGGGARKPAAKKKAARKPAPKKAAKKKPAKKKAAKKTAKKKS